MPKRRKLVGPSRKRCVYNMQAGHQSTITETFHGRRRRPVTKRKKIAIDELLTDSESDTELHPPKRLAESSEADELEERHVTTLSPLQLALKQLSTQYHGPLIGRDKEAQKIRKLLLSFLDDKNPIALYISGQNQPVTTPTHTCR